MICCGTPPYLECSTAGDQRFSGSTGLTWREAKGRRAVNIEQCQQAYRQWWAEWVQERGLLPVLQAVSGLSDRYGQPGSICQASVLWEIREALT